MQDALEAVVAEVERLGLAVSTPAGWEARIYRRPEHGEVSAADLVGLPAPVGERTHAVVHVSTIALPMDAADYASDVVDQLGADDVIVILKEFAPESATKKLFERSGIPRALQAHDFGPQQLQRSLRGQAGCQVFFHENGRAFCLYVVLGSYARRDHLIPKVNAVLATISIATLPAMPSAEDVTTTGRPGP